MTKNAQWIVAAAFLALACGGEQPAAQTAASASGGKNPIGGGCALAAIGFLLFALSHKPAEELPTLVTDKQGRPVVYGWLEMLDSNASRYPLRTTNVQR